jgi:hypothetical protein
MPVDITPDVHYMPCVFEYCFSYMLDKKFGKT